MYSVHIISGSRLSLKPIPYLSFFAGLLSEIVFGGLRFSFRRVSETAASFAKQR